MSAGLVRDHLGLLLLALLGVGPGHGYGLIAELRRRSNGLRNLPEGSVYPALHSLEEARLVRSRPADNGGRRRRTYQITARGNRELAKQRQAWWHFAGAVDGVLREVRIRVPEV